jgi:hypothetical protein
MKVTVQDRAAERRAWGHGLYRPVLRTVEIADTCPECGGPRGEPRSKRQHEDGEWYSVDVWDNPCGHVDAYVDVIKEATVTA